MTITIRRAVPEDAEAIATINVNCWHETYKGFVPQRMLDEMNIEESAQRWASQIERGAYIPVAEQNGSIRGFGRYRKNSDDAAPYKGIIKSLYVDRAVQKQGIGTALFKHMEDCLHQRSLVPFITEVELNNPACAFYEKMGGVRLKTDVLKMGDYSIDVYIYGWEE